MRLGIEWALLYLAGPVCVALTVAPESRSLGQSLPHIATGLPVGAIVFPLLWGAAAVMLVVLLRDSTFDRSQLLRLRPVLRELPRVLPILFGSAMVLLGLTIALDRGLFGLHDGSRRLTLFLPRERPGVMAMIALGYPLFSVWPQQIFSRTFFFHRYRPLFGGGRVLIAVNAAAFAWMHLAFWNPIAWVLTLIGGVLFAWTHARAGHNAAWLEHAIYGVVTFGVGLGGFLFLGNR